MRTLSSMNEAALMVRPRTVNKLQTLRFLPHEGWSGFLAEALDGREDRR